ncbi:hypothetical protein AAVH_26622 [Aphelenchoides avenae]|nr:hypothetical protein AAVH_26622 [Aphelenchus avenae]
MPAYVHTFTLFSLCIVASQAFYFNPGVRLYDLYRRASVRMPPSPFGALAPYNAEDDDVIPVYLDTDAADPATAVIVEEVDGSDGDDTVPMPKRSLNKIMRKYSHMRPRLVPF